MLKQLAAWTVIAVGLFGAAHSTIADDYTATERTELNRLIGSQHAYVEEEIAAAYAAFEEVPYPGSACGPNGVPGICNQMRQQGCTANYNWSVFIGDMLHRDGPAQTDRFIRAQAMDSWGDYDTKQTIAVALLKNYVTPRALYDACLARYR